MRRGARHPRNAWQMFPFFCQLCAVPLLGPQEGATTLGLPEYLFFACTAHLYPWVVVLCA